jgi:mono/diheme cytochrome c family protein
MGGSCAGEEAKLGDAPVKGSHDFALQVCSACHEVGKAQASKPILKPPAPSFLSIAGRRPTTEAFLRHFLSKPHGKMPNPALANFEIDEVVAYLLSPKPKR